MAENGGRTWTIWVAGIVATLILAILSFTGSGVVANNEASLSRDAELTRRATANEIRINRLEECQISMKETLTEIKVQSIKQSEKLDKILNKVQ